MSEVLPKPIGIEQRYFSAARLRAWANHKIGPKFTIVELARRLGWSETATRYQLNGTSSPNLESYCRALEKVGEPFGTWLDHIER